MAMSSVEAEYVVAAGCCAQVLWIKSQLADYDILYGKVPIFCNNTSAIAILNNLVLHSRLKHIDIRLNYNENYVGLPTKETVKAGLATLGLSDEKNLQLSSQYLINKSHDQLNATQDMNVCYTRFLSLIIEHKLGNLYKNDNLSTFNSYHITTASFSKTPSFEVPLTSYMLQVEKLSTKEPEKTLLLSSKEVNTDVEEVAKQPSTVATEKATKNMVEEQMETNAEITFMGATALDQIMEEADSDVESMLNDEILSISKDDDEEFGDSDNEFYVSNEVKVDIVADKSLMRSDPLCHLSRRMDFLVAHIHNLGKSLPDAFTDKMDLAIPRVVADALEERLSELLIDSLKASLPQLFIDLVKETLLDFNRRIRNALKDETSAILKTSGDPQPETSSDDQNTSALVVHSTAEQHEEPPSKRLKVVMEIPTIPTSVPLNFIRPTIFDSTPYDYEVAPTASLIVTASPIVTSYSKRKGKEVMVEFDTPKKQKLQEQIDAQVARELKEQQKKEDMRMNEQIARNAEVSQQRRPMTKKQKKDYYMAMIRNNLGWKVKDFKGMTFKVIEVKFAAVWKHVEDFIPLGSKEETERLKRKGLNLEQEHVKKQKTSEEAPEIEKIY
uniref:Retrovirus-related Pol polyprotein from transposon TNT 1-94 n=1 Tax=Tanacetum cinerariifolium TaxID=118510 RepID=A0A6L2JGM8_TANCI|nr:retrovirus-related Pol polyprotein from transposon TNT 1-94 [Tanacetum cinerariifolium]